MSEITTTLTAVFIASSVMLALTKKLRQPSIPGYIVAGVILSYLGFSISNGFIQVGAAFLAFIFGLKTEPERLKSVASDSFKTTVLLGAVLGIITYLVGQMLGFNPIDSLFLGISTAASSSLIGLELVREEIRAEVLHGRLSESVHLMQDVGVVAVIAVFSGTITGGGFPSVAATAALLIFALFVRSTILPLIEDRIERSREIAMLTSLSLLTGFIALSSQYDASFFASAFAAGLTLSKFPYNMETLETLGPIKDFFSAAFFVAVGTLVSFPGGDAFLATLLLIFLASVTKPMLAAFYLIYEGHDARTAYLTGLSLDQVGEFPLILSVQAFVIGTLSAGAFDAVAAAAAVTMSLSSYSSLYDEKIFRVLEKLGVAETNNKIENKKNFETLKDHIIVLGYDVPGKEIANFLEESGEKFLIVENNPDKIMEASEKNYNYVFGDVMRDETWDMADVESSKLVVSTIPVASISQRLVNMERIPSIFLVADGTKEARKLFEAGADFVQVPDILGAEEIKSHIEGVIEGTDYREELRRKNLLEIRRHLNMDEER